MGGASFSSKIVVMMENGGESRKGTGKEKGRGGLHLLIKGQNTSPRILKNISPRSPKL